MAQAYVTKTHRITPETAEKLRRLAVQEGTSENYEMGVALRVHLDTHLKRRK